MKHSLRKKLSAYIGIAALAGTIPLAQGLLRSKHAAAYAEDSQMDVWWPTNGVSVSGLQPFKAMMRDRSADNYAMYWQVDNDRLNDMPTNYNDYPHKEAAVDLSGWNWHSDGQYPISFIAKDFRGSIIAKQTVTIYLPTSGAAPQTQAASQSNTSTNTSTAQTSTLIAQTAAITNANTAIAQQYPLDIWWPTNGVTVSGTEPLKAMVENSNIADYNMFWQIDGGSLNQMSNSGQDYPHKESDVNVDQFPAASGNRHTLTFVVKDLNNNYQQQKSITIYTNNTVSVSGASAPAISAPAPAFTAQAASATMTNVQAQSTPTQNSDLVDNAYNQWKSFLVTSSGANGNLRVRRPENNDDTVSEGQGYGMLAAVAANDRSTFDGLWRYTQSHLNGNGLMGWHIDSSGNTIDSGAATDADEDIAYALMLASNKWGAYSSAARAMISNIYKHEVEQPSNVLKPGDVWGGSSAVNLSYFAPAYYKAFAGFTGNSGWNVVVDTNYGVLSKAANGSTGLVPDWTTASGGQSSYNMGPNQNNFTYDAIRTPLRIGMDAKWNGDSRAANALNAMTGFFSRVGAHNLKAGYTLSGSPVADYMDSTFISCIAAGASASNNSNFASQMNTMINNTAGQGYYGTSLRLISLMFINGQLR